MLPCCCWPSLNKSFTACPPCSVTNYMPCGPPRTRLSLCGPRWPVCASKWVCWATIACAVDHPCRQLGQHHPPSGPRRVIDLCSVHNIYTPVKTRTRDQARGRQHHVHLCCERSYLGCKRLELGYPVQHALRIQKSTRATCTNVLVRRLGQIYRKNYK